MRPSQLSVMELLESRALFSTVVPDATFGDGGFARLDGFGRMDHGSVVAVQADGKLLVAGGAMSTDGNWQGIVARFNPDGSRDASFSPGGADGDGVLVLDLLNDVRSMALLGDGRILLGGTGSNMAGLVRLAADGTLDTTFGAGGVTRVEFSAWCEAFERIAVGPDGRIVALSTANVVVGGDQGDFGIARFNPDGSLDPTFGGDGTVTTDFGHVNGMGMDAAFAIAFLPDGRLLVGGTTMDVAVTPLVPRDGGFALACYNDGGSLDTSFGDGGKTVTRFADVDTSDWVNWGKGAAHDLAVLPDGKVLAAGTSSAGALTLARYNADGSLDTSYSGDGIATGDGVTDGIYRVHALADGRFAVAAGQENHLFAATVDADGNVVASSHFGATGLYQQYVAVAFQADGKLVTAGRVAPAAVHVDLAWMETNDILVGRFALVTAEAPAQPAPPDAEGEELTKAERRRQRQELKARRLQERRERRAQRLAERLARRQARRQARLDAREATEAAPSPAPALIVMPFLTL